MYAPVLSTIALLACTRVIAAPAARTSRQTPSYVGYLITTFSDAKPEIQMHLSQGNEASKFTFVNGGQSILQSTVGTKAVRDPFLISDAARAN